MTNRHAAFQTLGKSSEVSESTEPLTECHASLREFVSNANLLAVTFNSSAEIIYCNGHFLRMTGLSLDEVMGRRWSQVFASPWPGDFAGFFLKGPKGVAEALNHESEVINRAGNRYWVRWNTIPERNSSGTTTGATTIGEDITERRHLERALLESGARERRYLEGELHDGLGQELFVLALSARSLAGSAKRDGKSIAEELERLSDNLSHAVDTCRRISRGISPLSELQGGLVDALRNLAATPKEWSGPALDFSLVQAAPLMLPAETLGHIYRLAQEGLTNALRHADASSIRINLNVQRTTVTLEIIDDGVGLQHPELTTGMGFELMRYRANVMGAHVHVAKGSNGGTHLVFRIEQ